MKVKRMLSRTVSKLADTVREKNSSKDFEERLTYNVSKQLYRRLPILSFLKEYSLQKCLADLIAGISVGLVLIPQGIAYAVVAKLPAEVGLYSSVMGCFLYIIFGTSPELSNAPAAITALMTGIYGAGDISVAIFQSFMGGILILAAGIFNLGFMINFISMPVISGFASAASLQIAGLQLPKMLGLELGDVERSDTGLGVVDDWLDTVGNIKECRWQDTVLGISCVVFLLILRAVNKSDWFTPADDQQVSGCRKLWNKIEKEKLLKLKKCVWFICTARNALVIILSILLVFLLEPAGTDCQLTTEGCVFTLTGSIKPGLPAWTLPTFLNREDFSKMAGEHMTGAALIALIAVLQNIAIAKSFAGSRTIDANQEMVALGICNFAGSFIGSLPVGGSFSRCAVNSASGVKTTIGGFYTGIIVLLCLLFLMPACALIPKATLGAVVFCGVIFTIEYHIVKPMWNSHRIDLVPGLATFFVCLFYRLEAGIAVGVLLEVCSVLYISARPSVEVEEIHDPVVGSYVIITPHSSVIFTSASHIKTIICKAVKKALNKPVVIDCSKMDCLDFTAAKTVKVILDDFTKKKQRIVWLNMEEEVKDTLTSVCKIETLKNLQELAIV